MSTHNLIVQSIDTFNLDLSGRVLLTEAASGNYSCTPLIAAAAGARVYAFGKDSGYGKYEIVREELIRTSEEMGIANRLFIVNDLENVPFHTVDIVTNTGFLRPIDKSILSRIPSHCVIPLMYEPWEFRPSDLDLPYCLSKGIRVIGTNESDGRLNTMSYIGYTVLYFLLHEKLTPQSARILAIGSAKFNHAIVSVLQKLEYRIDAYTTDEFPQGTDLRVYNAIVLTEFVSHQLLIGREQALIPIQRLNKDHIVIHIAGNTDIDGLKSRIYPASPAPARRMSYTTDFINPKAVIDLHAAGLKVAEGALKARELGIKDAEFASHMESNYPALLFRASEVPE